MSRKEVFGTKEWASHNVNCVNGCSHDCRYCYARGMAVRFGRKTVATWSIEEVREAEVRRARRKMSGTVMFPTTHDLTPGTLDACLAVLDKLVAADNRVLLVSKPHIDSMRAVCQLMGNRRGQILFRFTIGAMSDDVLRFWEPGAPTFGERLDCLRLVHSQGFETSVSCEPLLEPLLVDDLVSCLLPYTTDAIWLGKLNHVGKYVSVSGADGWRRLDDVVVGQGDDAVKAMYDRHCGNPQIKWKESIKKVVGLAVSQTVGLDA